MMNSVPVPDAIAQAHSRELTARLVESAEQASLPVSVFMDRCLYEPGLGYYMAGSQKFGADGDFITAPEVSPLFGACVAEQCAEVLALCGGGLLEMGAGSGRLALSVINALDDSLWSHYWIVEPSADLQSRQSEFLKQNLSAAQYDKVTWLQTLPESYTGVVLANEVMDALPVERVIRTAQGFNIEAVAATGQTNMPLAVAEQDPTKLSEGLYSQIDTTLAKIEKDLGRDWPVGYRSEVSLMLPAWIHSLADSLTQGVLLLIDYGYPRHEYYLDERLHGTLQCFYRHHAHSDITFWPGLQDITAHVDFTGVIEAGDAAGLELLGYTAQAPFLYGCGLAEKATTQSALWHAPATDATASRIQQQQAVNRLSLPGEMGERFQVMALGRGIEASLCGFSLLDLSHRL